MDRGRHPEQRGHGKEQLQHREGGHAPRGQGHQPLRERRRETGGRLAEERYDIRLEEVLEAAVDPQDGAPDEKRREAQRHERQQADRQPAGTDSRLQAAAPHDADGAHTAERCHRHSLPLDQGHQPERETDTGEVHSLPADLPTESHQQIDHRRRQKVDPLLRAVRQHPAMGGIQIACESGRDRDALVALQITEPEHRPAQREDEEREGQQVEEVAALKTRSRLAVLLNRPEETRQQEQQRGDGRGNPVPEQPMAESKRHHVGRHLLDAGSDELFHEGPTSAYTGAATLCDLQLRSSAHQAWISARASYLFRCR